MDYKTILEKIKKVFSEEELAIPAVEDMPQVEDKKDEPETTDMEKRVSDLEAKIAELEALLLESDAIMQKKEDELKAETTKVTDSLSKIEELSKQLTDKETKITSLEVELSKTPSVEQINLERHSKETSTFASKMMDQIRESRKEKGLDY